MTNDDAEQRKIETLRRLGGTVAEGKFVCMACGRTTVLRFNAQEVRELNGVKNYEGPCPDCKLMHLLLVSELSV